EPHGRDHQLEVSELVARDRAEAVALAGRGAGVEERPVARARREQLAGVLLRGGEVVEGERARIEGVRRLEPLARRLPVLLPRRLEALLLERLGARLGGRVERGRGDPQRDQHAPHGYFASSVPSTLTVSLGGFFGAGLAGALVGGSSASSTPSTSTAL